MKTYAFHRVVALLCLWESVALATSSELHYLRATKPNPVRKLAQPPLEKLVSTPAVARSEAAILRVPFVAGALEYVDFFDTTDENRGNCGGAGPVDAQLTTGLNPTCPFDCYLSHTEEGEWVEYEFQSTVDQYVGITAKMASNSPRQVELLLDGNSIGNTIQMPGEGWHEFLDRSVQNVLVTGGVPHRLRIVFTDGRVNLCSVSISALQVPFEVPALELTDYFDTTDEHRGDCEAGGPVDAKFTGENPTCSMECFAAYTAAGEWTEYTFLSENDALINVVALVASKSTRKRFRILLDGRYISDYLTGPGEGWEVFRERASKEEVYVRAGTLHRLRVEFIDGGINLCSLQVKLSSTLVPGRDGSSGSSTIRIEAENYGDSNELTPNINHGGEACDRGDGVDMQLTNDSNGGKCNVGWSEPGEWLEYGLVAMKAQSFTVSGRLASNSKGKFVHIEIDGDEYQSVEAPDLGWHTYADRILVSDLYLKPGPHTLRFVFDTGRVNLNYLEVSGAPRKPFDVAAYLPRQINTCFVGDRCDPGTTDCVGLYDDNGRVAEGFTADTFRSVEPADKYGDSVCLELKLTDGTLDRLEESLDEFARNVYLNSNREIELNVRMVQLDSLDLSLTPSCGGCSGFNLKPDDILDEAVDKLDFVPDFGIIIPPTRDPELRLSHGLDWGGLAFLGWPTIAGACSAWVPEDYAINSGYLGHEWLHLLEYSYHQHSYIPTIYPDRQSFPPCGEGHWDSFEWLPSADDCTFDPDFISCGEVECFEHEVWGPHILRAHFNPGVAYVPNHCKNGDQDFSETGIDSGGRCLDLEE